MLRVATTYMVVAWLLVQVGDALAPVLRLPDWVVAFVVYLLVLCFPIALILAWAYDAGPTGICATTTTHKTPPRQMALLGVLTVGATVLLFAVLSVTIGGVPARASATPWQSGELRERSIAVLPFEDHSPGGGQAWLANGLAQELLVLLSAIERLRVAEASEAHSVRAGSDVRAVGQQLGVATLLGGTVQRVGARVRVNVRLTDTGSGFQIWSQSYEGQVDDVFAFQSEVAGRIVADLEVQFAAAPQHALDGPAFN
ncbi:MAG: hypothetical protein WD081_07795 [Gammaproteobacteria bacterium]